MKFQHLNTYKYPFALAGFCFVYAWALHDRIKHGTSQHLVQDHLLRMGMFFLSCVVLVCSSALYLPFKGLKLIILWVWPQKIRSTES